jgi:hypothetical protein
MAPTPVVGFKTYYGKKADPLQPFAKYRKQTELT